LQHIVLVHELLQHAAQRLFGDFENIEKVGHFHSGMAGDEMQDAVVRAPEAEFGERLIGIADEVAIGEEQKLDQVPYRLAGVAAMRVG
jgi:hypothetical protein